MMNRSPASWLLAIFTFIASTSANAEFAGKVMAGWQFNSYEYLAVSGAIAPFSSGKDEFTPDGPTISASVGIGGSGAGLGYAFQQLTFSVNPRLIYFRKSDEGTYHQSKEWAGIEVVLVGSNHVPGNLNIGVVSSLGSGRSEVLPTIGVGLGW